MQENFTYFRIAHEDMKKSIYAMRQEILREKSRRRSIKKKQKTEEEKQLELVFSITCFFSENQVTRGANHNCFL